MPGPTSLRRIAVLIPIVVAVTQCGGGRTPAGPAPPQLTIVCPAAQSATSANGVDAIVSYPPATTTGGTAPTSTLCLPPSGGAFTIGTTTVTCSAADSSRQNTTCSFSITVAAPPPPPRISVTRFVAFGDSITEGLPRTLLPSFIPNPSGSYPADLEALLRARYTTQPEIAVLDEGIGGELIGDGLARLPRVLADDGPGAVLLMEGANDLNTFGAGGLTQAVSGLRSMVRAARPLGPVFLGTLLPERGNGTPPRAAHPELVVPLNDAIRAMAVDEGAVLVDLYQAFGGTADSPLIGSDGLHPTADGNAKIAQTFFDAIAARLETTSTDHRAGRRARR